MSEIKHTSGPWSLGHSRTSKYYSYEVSVCVGEGQTQGNPICRVSMGGDGALHSTEEYVLANAKLIACAPDMLEALQVAYAHLIANGHNPTSKIISDAINKATK